MKKLRIAKGLSQAEVARIIGVSRSAVNKWERTNVIPRQKRVIELAKLYECPVEELLESTYGCSEEVSKNEKDPKYGK